MECLIGTKDFKIGKPTVVTIGKFDGRHKGHQKLLEQMLELKQEHGYQTAVYTFLITPAAVVGRDYPYVLMTNEERRMAMAEIGIDYLIEYPFSDEVAQMRPADFVKDILVGQMNAKIIVAGSDCGFGYRRSGNIQLLKKLSRHYGYEVVVIEKERDEVREISSTYIREQLALGKMEKVTGLLGQPYTISGLVSHGNHIGGPKLGFPTVNLLPAKEKLLPPFGVYVSAVLLEGVIYGGITNIGRKPTIEKDDGISVETYLFEFNRNVYGRYIQVSLLSFHRPEQKFSSLKALKEQIERDKQFGKEYLKRYGLIDSQLII